MPVRDEDERRAAVPLDLELRDESQTAFEQQPCDDSDECEIARTASLVIPAPPIDAPYRLGVEADARAEKQNRRPLTRPSPIDLVRPAASASGDAHGGGDRVSWQAERPREDARATARERSRTARLPPAPLIASL